MAVGSAGPIKTLERKYASILGELVVSSTEEEADDLNEILAAIHIVIRLWEPDWLPDHIKPIRSRKSYAMHGIQSRLLFEFIRARTGSFTALEAAEYVSVRLEKLGETIPPIANIRVNAHNLMRKLEGTFVMPNNTRPETWERQK